MNGWQSRETAPDTRFQGIEPGSFPGVPYPSFAFVAASTSQGVEGSQGEQPRFPVSIDTPSTRVE